ncbi:MAG: hypothetical protein J6L86_05010 [Alphaproteobacteria bacterium]|nr:hypothetical protein [Alphaproteobacteria bacterium]
MQIIKEIASFWSFGLLIGFLFEATLLIFMLQRIFQYFISDSARLYKTLTILTAPFLIVYIYDPRFLQIPYSIETAFVFVVPLTIILKPLAVFSDKEIK